MRWLGVDGGGTKTRFDVYDEGMRRVQSVKLPTCHPGQVGYDGMRAVLAEGVALCCADGADAGAPLGIGFGLAGYGQDPDVRAQMERVVREVAVGHPYELVSDVRAAWAASLGARDGAVIICGTGSIAYAARGGRERRAGGWGYHVGDEGSGWWMGREVLRLFSRQADGRDERGPLFEVVMEQLGLSAPYDIIAYASEVLKGDRTKVASLTSVLRAAAQAGDPCALDVYRRAARELAAIARAACAGLFDGEGDAGSVPVPASMERDRGIAAVPVGYVGGVFEGAGRLLLDPLARALGQGFDLRAPRFEPAAGACLLLKARLDGAPFQE